MKLFNHLLYFETLESTNDFLKENAHELPNYSTVIAKHQTKGRGQFERAWESLANENLLFSILIKNDFSSEFISQTAVTCMIETLKHFGIPSTFKIPNDILVGKNKICGILIETKYTESARDFLILGIGLNVNQIQFETINATSMRLLTGLVYDHDTLLRKFLDTFENYIS